MAPTIPTVNGIENLVAFYDLATEGELAEGKAWYAAATIIARGFAARYAIEFVQAAGVIAALSPRMHWSRNIELADMIIASHKAGIPSTEITGAFKANVNKAYAILNGNPPLDILGGNKVRAFYRNIVGSEGDVTVDTWAYRAWVADISLTPARITDEQYNRIAEDYRTAARIKGVSPRDFQAIVWVVIRNLSRSTK